LNLGSLELARVEKKIEVPTTDRANERSHSAGGSEERKSDHEEGKTESNKHEPAELEVAYNL